MTLELYDGARVLLRNGETFTIRRIAGEYKKTPYVWRADGATPAHTWTAEGCYTIGDAKHPLDIVGLHKTDTEEKAMFDRPNSDLFDIIPYSADYQPRGDEKYGLRNGREINGLIFLGDEIHTSQRDMVWTRIDGRCRVPSRHDLANARDISEAGISRLLSQHDIVGILIPKAPAELASKRLNPDLLIRDEIDPYFHGNMNETSLDPVNADNGEMPLPLPRPHSDWRQAFKQRQREKEIVNETDDVHSDSNVTKPHDPDANVMMQFDRDLSMDYPYTAPNTEGDPVKLEEKRNLTRTVMMDESGHVYDDMEVPENRPKLAPIEDRREAAIQRMTGVGGDWRETQVPRKRLYKTMESIAESLGGEFGEWEWGADPSTIRFSVLFDNPMRNGVHVGYEKWLTLSVTDDEHNAILPMTARK